ncbi:hypothetical protein [Bacteriovorax sp. DB6_IX]|uniref:hypothetical protein n=1 Tax=Bacteriovorax sp. DB6_IX TaxID=1353530 RepID=UPI00038A08D2|nr:hypothetical protein [Bacteriovorax sp. DB6_IX]EQC50590.1 hypothetical protein M901_2192 [Bacteriovorax sp. DB6_IX]
MNSKVLERVAEIMDSKNVESDWKMLTWLQKEQAPWLSDSEVEDCVIYSLVKCYDDYELSWLWYESNAEHYSDSLAA